MQLTNMFKFIFLFSLIWLIDFNAYSETRSQQPARSEKNMVVSAQHYATEVGLNVLKQGGNAIDAAVAMGYALAVVHPCCGNIGGGGFMLVHQSNGKNIVINFREKAPHAIKPSLFWDQKGNVISSRLTGGYEDGHSSSPYLSMGIPGTVLGFEIAHQLLGSLPLKNLIEPAVNLASQGYRLETGDVDILEKVTKDFLVWPHVSKIFLKNQQPYQVGDRLIQTQLANTLNKIKQGGSARFYHGDLANDLWRESEKGGGVITKDDLANYRVRIQQPLVCHYHGYEVVTLPPPGSGITVCQILAASEKYPLGKWGFHSEQNLKMMAALMYLAFQDRRNHLGDPTFVQVSVERLLSKEHIKTLQLQAEKSLIKPNIQLFNGNSTEGHQTTAYLVADSKGNVAAVTYTINDLFGSRIIPGELGYFLNNELADFYVPNKGDKTQSPNIMQGDKIPLSAISQVFLIKNGHVDYVFATPGGATIITQIVEVIQNVLDFHMNIKQAIDAPRYHVQNDPRVIFMEKGALSENVQKQLKQNGYTLKFGSPWHSAHWGAINAMHITEKGFEGAMDYRRPAGLAHGN